MWSNGLTIWWTQNPCTGYREPVRDSFLVGAEKSFLRFLRTASGELTVFFSRLD
jgi:hypothetical protein